MTPEAQRIAIAEACGWTAVRRADCVAGQVSGVWKSEIRNWVPDYLNDLNAMHEAEECLIKRGLARELGDELISVTTVDRGIFFARATAAQRAKAFLRTIGKWEESA